jgi:hypothetical protein
MELYAYQNDSAWVTTKGSDIIAYPFYGKPLVEKSDVYAIAWKSKDPKSITTKKISI